MPPRVECPFLLPLLISFKYHQIRGYRHSWSLQLTTSYLLSWTCVQLCHTLESFKNMMTTATYRLYSIVSLFLVFVFRYEISSFLVTWNFKYKLKQMFENSPRLYYIIVFIINVKLDYRLDVYNFPRQFYGKYLCNFNINPFELVRKVLFGYQIQVQF